MGINSAPKPKPTMATLIGFLLMLFTFLFFCCLILLFILLFALSDLDTLVGGYSQSISYALHFFKNSCPSRANASWLSARFRQMHTAAASSLFAGVKLSIDTTP